MNNEYELIYEGKAKKVFTHDDADKVIIEFKDDATAFNALKKAKFNGKVTLSDIDAPNGYTIAGEGTGGAAGFAKGGASVILKAEGSETILSYEAKAAVGGKLAQIGSRLIDSTSKKLANQFFSNFAKALGADEEEDKD